MAGSVNKVIVIGNLGADPEVRDLPSGQKVANLRVATSEQWTDRTSGENASEQNGILSASLTRTPHNTLKTICERVIRYTLKAAWKPVNGKTNPAQTAIAQKLLLTKSVES